MASSNGTVDVEEALKKIEAQLAPLAAAPAVRKSVASTNKILLDRSAPIIRAARAKGHGWRKISEALRAAGVFVSRTSLARHFEEETSGTSSGSTKKKVRKKRLASAHAQTPDWKLGQTNGSVDDQDKEQSTGAHKLPATDHVEPESRPAVPTPHAGQSRRRQV